MNASNTPDTVIAWHQLHDVGRKLAGDVGRIASVRYWTKRHPWFAISISVAAGFVAAENAKRHATAVPGPSPPPAGGRPGNWAGSKWVSFLVHGILDIFFVGLRSSAMGLSRAIFDRVKRLENWNPPR